MPLPFAMVFVAPTAAPFMMNAAMPLCVGVASAGKYAYDNFYTPSLPTFQHEAEVVCNKGLSEARELALETREKLALDEELSRDERARMGDALTRMESTAFS